MPKTYSQLKTQADRLRSERHANRNRLREIESQLSKSQGEHADQLSKRGPLETKVVAGSVVESELDELDSNCQALANQINSLQNEKAELHNRNNLVSTALAQIQKDVKNQFHDELWAHYERDFPKILKEFEFIIGRLLCAQLARTKVEGDFVGVVRWLVQRGEIKDPGACFRDELERVGIYSNV